MSRIVFFCIPAHGHTNPTLGVVRELTARGHEVLYYSYTPFREKIEAAGARFIACDAFDAEQRLTQEEGTRIGSDLALSTRVLVDTTLALDDMVCAEMERLKPDCIVADSMAVWGKAVAMKLGIPFVCSTTTFAFNQHSAKIMKQSVGQMVSMMFSMPKISKQIKRLQDRGYPVKSILDIISNDDNTHTIVYTSPQFQPCAETFSDKYAFVGPSIRPAAGEVEKTGEKLVYISMGTVNNDMLPLYRNCIEALKDTPYQVILSVGGQVDPAQFGKLPENIAVYPSVDQIAVLEKADVFLSHCGMNSVSESLYHSVPLVMLPQTSEQGGVAVRTAQLGAGIRLEKTTPQAIRAAVETVLKDPAYRKNAAAIAAGFQACSGPKGAADKIESCCKNG
ncbi:MAG: macrolide family glycosyltransferase [Oscillospiraceae bacterium]|nr:macrolide family glycosyltransferase [Oscillospiraceae bacterium]